MRPKPPRRWLPVVAGISVLLPALLVAQTVEPSLSAPANSPLGAFSAPQGSQASYIGAPVTPGTPGAPGNLGAVALTINQVYLSWSRESPASKASPEAAIVSYTVRRDGKIAAEVSADRGASASALTASYVDTGLTPSTTYSYTVEAVDASGRRSQLSSVVQVRTPDAPEIADTEAPTAPESLTAAITPDGYVLLDWYSSNDDTGVAAYKISRNSGLLTVISHGAQSYIDKTLRARKLTVIKSSDSDTDQQQGAAKSTGANTTTYTYTIVGQDVMGKPSKPEEITLELEGAEPITDKAPDAPQSNVPVSRAASGPTTYTAQLSRYPYLTDLVQTYATVNWATDRSATTGSVRWGQVANDGSCSPTNSVTATKSAFTVNSVPEYQWKAQLSLSANTQYCYRVFLGSVDLLGSDPTPRFWTQVPAGAPDPYTFAVFGDWGEVDSTGANPEQADLMQQIAGSGARFAFTTGDNGYPSGSHTNYGDLQQVGADMSVVFGPDFWARPGALIPLFPTMGNHGRSSSSVLHPHLLNWPQDQAVSTSAGRYSIETYCCLNGTTSGQYPSTWYAFDGGTARFYVLDASWSNSNVGTADLYTNDHDYHWPPTSDEYQWLENDLAAHPGGVKFAFFHFPMYSANSSEASDTWLQGTNSLEGLLSRYGVGIAFFGHAHIYTRTIKANSNSLVTYLTGGGGAKLEPVSRCASPVAYARGWSYSANGGLGAGSSCGGAPVPTSRSQVFHYLLVSVNGSQVTVRPTDSQGNTFDVQTYTFSGGPTPVATSTATSTASVTPTSTATSIASTSTPTPTATGIAATSTATSIPTSTATSTATPIPTGVPTNTSTATSTPGSQLLTFAPDADAYVDQNRPTTNLGTLTSLHVDGSAGTGGLAYESYLRFTVSGLTGTISNARLRLYNFNGTVDGPAVYSAGNSWTETGINWNNRTARTSGATDDKGRISANTWVEYNVTPLLAGNGTYTFNLATTSTDGIDFNSREATTNQPQLVITTTTP